ncbi:unnamed protein product [Musa textilis]
MAGLFAFSLAGLGFLFLGAIESLSISTAPALLPPPLLLRLRFISALLLSSLSLLSSLVSSLSSAKSAADPLGRSLPLSSLTAAAPFLLYSLAGLLSLPSGSLLVNPFPSSLLDLVLLFSFGQEFLLFHFRRKDLDGVENRYFDLLLVPILVCAISTLLAIARPRSPAPCIARAAGLAFHGTWLIQMGFSFFTNLIAHGCSVHERSATNYTIKCKTHEDYHRGRAIATLQFNCHLAFLILVGTVAYGVLAGRTGGSAGYRPLSKELQMTDASPSNFILDSDEEEELEAAETKGTKQHQDVVLPVVEIESSNGSH